MSSLLGKARANRKIGRGLLWLLALAWALPVSSRLPSGEHRAHALPLGNTILGQQSQSAELRRVFAPYDVPAEEAAIFWFGQVTPTVNAGDVRVTYRDDYVYIRVAASDRRLWYDTSPSPGDLTAWDAVSLYLDTSGNHDDAPGTDAYRFDAQLNWWGPREGHQAAYQGDGTGWLLATLPFTTTSFWRGNQPNDSQDDRGWAVAYQIPYDSLAVQGPPTSEALWGLAVVLHDRDDIQGTPIADQVWPEAMQAERPSTWGQLRFGLPTYTPPPALVAATTLIRQGLDGATVVDADVGGSSVCGAPAAPDYFPTWGELNWAGKTFVNIQNLGDIGDWPCFSRAYVTFPLDAVPSDQAIISATLTLHLWGGAGEGYDPGPQPSLIQLSTVGEDWDESTLSWNNAPLARENISATWVEPVVVAQDPPGLPYRWDASRAVAEAYASGTPVRLALYEADWAYHSGKYFHSSDVGDWNAEGRPTLTIAWGPALGKIDKAVTPTFGDHSDSLVYTLSFLATGNHLTLTDTLPIGLSTPIGFTVDGTGIVPAYDSEHRRISWIDTPPTGQRVTICYTSTIVNGDPEVLVNRAELRDAEGLFSIDTARVIANPHLHYLPVVIRGR